MRAVNTNPSNNTGNLNKTYNSSWVPEFVPPSTITEANERVAELELAIASINDQIEVKKITGPLDQNWYRGATASRRFKQYEVTRLRSWLQESISSSGGGFDLNAAIVDVVREDYSEDDWNGVVEEAQRKLSGLAS